MWVFDTHHKKLVLYSLFIYYPALSLIVGTPIPFPSIVNVTSEQIAIFNFISLLITIMGSIVGVGYYLERRNNLKINSVDEHIDESVIAVRTEIKELRNEMKEMEKRICDSLTSKNREMEKNVEEKVATAKELVDTRFRHLEDITRELRSNYHQYGVDKQWKK